jgi:Derlin-2/3
MRPGDFFVFVSFLCTGILILNTWIFGGQMLQGALIFGFAYYWTAWQPANNRVNFYVATFPVKVLPPLMLLVTFVQAGLPAALVEVSGGIVAHLYLFVTEIWPNYGAGHGRSLVWTPQWVHNLFERSASIPRPAAAPPAPKPMSGSIVNLGSSSTGTSTQDGGSATGSSLFGKKPDGWSHRGAGHKLGS